VSHWKKTIDWKPNTTANRVQKQCSFFSLGKCVLPSTFASRW
jgi:hypothetical protein